MAEVAEDCVLDLIMSLGSSLFKALSHVNYNVRMATADALAEIKTANPKTPL